jgi:hypothetical protein
MLGEKIAEVGATDSKKGTFPAICGRHAICWVTIGGVTDDRTVPYNKSWRLR